jgi:hypothetical protein
MGKEGTRGHFNVAVSQVLNCLQAQVCIVYTTQAALPPGDKDRTGWGRVLIGLFGS